MNVRDVPHFEDNLVQALVWRAEEAGLQIVGKTPGIALQGLIRALYEKGGPVVVLIDEYDKPILDKMGDLEAAEAMRMALRSFYTVVKASCSWSWPPCAASPRPPCQHCRRISSPDP